MKRKMKVRNGWMWVGMAVFSQCDSDRMENLKRLNEALLLTYIIWPNQSACAWSHLVNLLFMKMMGENRGTGWPVILAHTPVIYMFTPNPPTPTKSASHLFLRHTHCRACASACVRAGARLPFVFACAHVWLGKLTLSARKSPAARIWSWESVLCSADMWHGAKMGTQPLSISGVQRCPITASALPGTSWVLRKKLHIAKNKFTMLKTPHVHCQKPVRITLNINKVRLFLHRCPSMDVVLIVYQKGVD